MRYLPYLLIPIVIAFIYSIAEKENRIALHGKDNDVFIMRLPKIYVWTGSICSALFTALFILMVIFPNDTASIWVGVVFIAFAVMGGILVISCYKWRIFIYENHMLYVTTFGREYKYEYTEIKSAELTQNYLKIKTMSKTLNVDLHAIGIDVILDRFYENNIVVKRDKNYRGRLS